MNTDILQKIKNNDRKAITELYYQIFSPMMSIVVRYKHNEEDQKTLVNNAFMKIIANINTYNPNLPFIPWIQKIARNEVIDSFRKEKNYAAFFNFDLEVEQEDVPEFSSIDTQYENEYLRNLLQTLPPATNLVFNLYAIEGYSSKEICEQLSIGYETVKWHIKEARKRLKIQLELSKNKVVL